MILLLLACGPGAPATCTPTTRSSAPTLAVTTADPRFSSGSLRVGDVDALDPARFGATPDALVRVLDGVLYLVDRGEYDTITAFDPLDAGCPLWQTDLGPNANAHDVVLWNDRLVLPLYDAGELAVLDRDGAVLDPIQVPGGNPALDRAVVIGDTLWVADQRFDREDWSTSEGMLLAVRDDGITEVGPIVNPRLSAGRSPTELLVADGILALDDDPTRRRDGTLRAFDTTTSTFSEPLLTEQALDADIQVAAAVGAQVVVSAADAEARSRVHCVGVGDGPVDGGWLPVVVPWEGRALVAARSGPAGAGDRGLWVVDPHTCERVDLLPVEGTEAYDVAVF